MKYRVLAMLRFGFVAQTVPHQCTVHHSDERRAAAVAEETTAGAPPSRLWIQSKAKYRGTGKAVPCHALHSHACD